MPKKPVDYSKTVIYKLVCNDLEITDIYVGSTSNFRNRKNTHKSSCNNEKSKKYKLKVYQTIRENGGWNTWSMIEIEKYPCKDKNEALARERYWYEELKAKLNVRSPSLTAEEKKEYMKKYNATEERKESGRKYDIEHREERKEKKRKYDATEEGKEKSRKYNAEHREEKNRKARESYAKKKAEKILI